MAQLVVHPLKGLLNDKSQQTAEDALGASRQTKESDKHPVVTVIPIMII